MDEKSPIRLHQESVQDEKVTMQKCRLIKKFGYREAIIVHWGLTIGLVYLGILTLCLGRSQVNIVVDCKEEGLQIFKSEFEDSQKNQTSIIETSELVEVSDSEEEDGNGSSTLNPGTSESNEMVDNKGKVWRQGTSLGITLLIIFLAYLGSFFTSHVIAARELIATPPKKVTSKTLTLIRIWKPSGLALLAVDFIGLMLGYPDMTICTFLILFGVLLFWALLDIIYIEWFCKVDENDKEEQRMFEEEAKALEQASADKIEAV